MITLKRALLRQKLESALPCKTAVSEQQSQLGQRLQSLKAVTLRASAVGDQLADVHAQISTVKESNRVRAEQLEAASKQLAAKRTELLVHVMPDAMRSNQLLLSMHSEELYVEQQKRMSKLLQILPLNLAGFRRGASPRTPGACVTLMGLRLPEDLKPTVDGQQQAQALGTALGYFATLSCLVAYYLDGPSLYMTVPACPTTLLPERTASQPTVSLTSLANSTIWGNAAGGNTVRVGKGQQDPELRNALHLLNRNVGALLAHTAGPSIHKVAPDLSVFAKLERLCASVLREPGHTPAAGAASASVTASIFAAGMAESCMDMSMLPDVNGESSDDWHLIQRRDAASRQLVCTTGSVFCDSLKQPSPGLSSDP
ncbi:hypothetical protein WJX79_001264 [Trebouxia sp. C0005]